MATSISLIPSSTLAAPLTIATNLSFANVTVATNLTDVSNYLYRYNTQYEESDEDPTGKLSAIYFASRYPLRFVNGSLALQTLSFSADDPVSVNFEDVRPKDDYIRPESEESFNLNITLFNDDITALTFNASGTGFEYLAPSIAGFFNKTSFAKPVTCAFPLSGQYGGLPRILFYVLLVAGLFLRHHSWLSTAALGTAMVYSASASVHALALVFLQTDSEWFDVDIQGIFPILVAGCIMVTPVLNWSLTMRRNEARPVVVLWGFVLFAAAIGCLLVFNGESGGQPQPWRSVAICQRDPEKPICSVDQDLTGLNKTSYYECECVDLCGTIQIDQPLRKNMQLSAWLVGDKMLKLLSDRKSGSLEKLDVINYIVLSIVIIQGILSLIEAQVSQMAVRNWIYRKLTKAYLHDPYLIEVRGDPANEKYRSVIEASKEKGLRSSLVKHGNDSIRWFAKFFAAFFYLLSVALAAICPFLFFSSIIVNEIAVRQYSTSEEEDAVGQWNPWVGTLLVIIAAIIVRYRPAIRGFIGRSYGAILYYKNEKSPFRQSKCRNHNFNPSSSSWQYRAIKRKHAGTSIGLHNGSSLETLAPASTTRDTPDRSESVQRPREKKYFDKHYNRFFDTLKSMWYWPKDFRDEFVEWWKQPWTHSTWDWVIIDDATVSLEMRTDELGDLYQSWDTPPEVVKGLIGPYFRKDRTRAPLRIVRKKPPKDKYHEVLQELEKPIKVTHTSFNIFAAASKTLQDDIEQRDSDLKPQEPKSLDKWLKSGRRMLQLQKTPDEYFDHHKDEGEYCRHCRCRISNHIPTPFEKLNIKLDKGYRDLVQDEASEDGDNTIVPSPPDLGLYDPFMSRSSRSSVSYGQRLFSTSDWPSSSPHRPRSCSPSGRRPSSSLGHRPSPLQQQYSFPHSRQPQMQHSRHSSDSSMVAAATRRRVPVPVRHQSQGFIAVTPSPSPPPAAAVSPSLLPSILSPLPSPRPRTDSSTQSPALFPHQESILVGRRSHRTESRPSTPPVRSVTPRYAPTPPPVVARSQYDNTTVATFAHHPTTSSTSHDRDNVGVQGDTWSENMRIYNYPTFVNDDILGSSEMTDQRHTPPPRAMGSVSHPLLDQHGSPNEQ